MQISQILSWFKISSTRLLALQALQCNERFTNHMTDREFTDSQKYIFNVCQITTLGGNPTFSGEETDKNNECTKTCRFKR